MGTANQHAVTIFDRPTHSIQSRVIDGSSMVRRHQTPNNKHTTRHLNFTFLAQMRSPVEGPKIRDLLDRCDIVLTERKSKDFNTKDIDQVTL